MLNRGYSQGDTILYLFVYLLRKSATTPHPSAFGCHLPLKGKAFSIYPYFITTTLNYCCLQIYCFMELTFQTYNALYICNIPFSLAPPKGEQVY
jgi:hypothetical protein